MNDRIIQIANLTITERNNPQRNRVYHPLGIAPCIYAYNGGGLQPLAPIVYER